MATFLLWNTGRKNVDSLVHLLVREHAVDVLMLVEFYPADSGSKLSTLLEAEGLLKRESSQRFGVFGKRHYILSGLPLVGLGDRVELWNCGAPDNPLSSSRFALVHGLDRINNDDGTRRVFFRRIVDAIRKSEIGSHRRSMVVGDFNAHPFESAIVSSDGLHALGIRRTPDGYLRQIRWGSELEDFFYNPMWRKYGHDPLFDAGMATHYWQNNLAGEFFWHMLDQVVIRPEECANFPEDRLKIVTRIGAVNLLAPNGQLDVSVGSDHLPVVFQWNFEQA